MILTRKKGESLEDFQRRNLERSRERRSKMAELDKSNGQVRRTPYIKGAELTAELEKWRDSAENPADRVPSERLGRMFMEMANRYLGSPNFVQYTREMKQDMASMAVARMLKSLPRYNFDFGNPFAYFTQIAWACAMTYLTRYYNDLKHKREMIQDRLYRAKEENPAINFDQSYMAFLKTMVGEKQITEQDEKILGREKEKIVAEMRAEVDNPSEG